MDIGWISTVVSPDSSHIQLSAMTADAAGPVSPTVNVIDVVAHRE